MGRKRPGRKMTKKQRDQLRKKKRRKRILILLIELLILSALGAAAYAVFKLDKLDYKPLEEGKLEVYKDTGEFTNIALFGLDSREGELDSEVRSDCMMIASINNETFEVKVVSVFRDTLMQQEDGSYDKANAAYFYGGPQEAVALLNRNLDLDIRNYMSVNFNALADVIDLLGGIEINLTSEEVFWTNGYCTETKEVVGRETTELTSPGLQTLDGIQAVAYSRIRYTEGDDFKRAERQRTVLEQVMKKAKSASLGTLNRIVDKVFPQVSTSLSSSDLVSIASNVIKYQIGEMSGYPFDVTTTENVIGMEGSYVTAIGFADNVKQLHKFLFGVENYKTSDKVDKIDNDIIYLTGVDPVNYGPANTSDETGDGTGNNDGSTDETGTGYNTENGYGTEDGYSGDNGYLDGTNDNNY